MLFFQKATAIANQGNITFKKPINAPGAVTTTASNRIKILKLFAVNLLFNNTIKTSLLYEN